MSPVRIGALILVISILFSIAPPIHAAPLPFPDMEWSFYRYKDAVQFLKDRRVITGNPDGTFRPRETVNRAEFLKMLLHGDRDIIDPDRRCFSDVDPREWYAPYVCTAKERTIVQGYVNGNFQPSDPVNMAEAIKMTMRVHEIAAAEVEGKDWFKPYTEALQKADLLPEHSYIAWEAVSRERAADLLWRVIRFKEDRVIPRLSEGCGKAAGPAPSSIMVSGVNRQFLLTVPKGYKAHDPSPLVIAFHGRTNSNEQVRSYMKLDRQLTDSFIAYPAAISNGNGSFAWDTDGGPAYQLTDVKFFDTIVETLAKNYCIDMDRISVTGHSLGAWMANSVACLRGGAVMASATVGGDSVITDCTGPASALIAHNPKDNLASYTGAERVLKLRMEENKCDWDQKVPGPTSLNCTRYPTCAGTIEILFCPHNEDNDHRGVFYPHTWPDSLAKEIQTFLQSLK